MGYAINIVHDFINLLAKKQQIAYFTPAQIDSFLQHSQMGLFSKYYGKPEELASVIPRGIIQYENTQFITDAFAPFKVTKSFDYPDTPAGLITLPTNYEHLTGLYTIVFDNKGGKVKHKGVQILTEDQISKRLDSQILAPSISKPFAVFTAAGIQLYPQQPMTGVYYYLRTPATPLYNYTQNGRQVTFNPTGSQNLEWNNECQEIIIFNTLGMMGINMDDQVLIEIGQLKTKQGVTA